MGNNQKTIQTTFIHLLILEDSKWITPPRSELFHYVKIEWPILPTWLIAFGAAKIKYMKLLKRYKMQYKCNTFINNKYECQWEGIS